MMHWKCVQDQTELISLYLTIVTWDLTERWTENVSKYKIELKSVFLTIVTWDLTERWTENVSNYKIELKPVYLRWYFKYNIRFIGIS